jgi:N-acetylneuraminate synthase/N,N'-diacetyllegionaminate synthase
MKILNNPFKTGKNSVFYIAEIGGNHEGDYNYAKELTQLAIHSGADAVKFQFYTGDSLVSGIEDKDRNAHFKKFELSNKQNLDLLHQVIKSNAIPMASVWNEKMLSWADPYLPIHKVGSGDLTCFPMLSILAATNKPIILSTGLSSLKEVSNAVAYIDKCNPSYISQRKLALLQCTSSYPTPDEDANINAMLTLKQEFGFPVGYSDHTLGVSAIEIAVAMGAEIIEKHFTDTRQGKTFRDHKVSLTKDEVQGVLEKMKKIVILKGKDEKFLTNSEKIDRHHITFRRGIYVNRDIKVGEIIEESDLDVLRPLHGICSSRFYDVLGCQAVRSIKARHALHEEDIVAVQ